MSESFKKSGYDICDFGDKSDVIVINSCTVTKTSDHKVRQILHKARRINPEAVIVLSGCMPQAFPEKVSEWSDADIIIGNSDRKNVTCLVEDFIKKQIKCVDISAHNSFYEDEMLESFGEKTRAFVKIEDGCSCFCSYCIIPYARGRVRSKSLDSIRAEIETLSKNNYSEVVLVGINLCAYGQDTGVSLTDAIDTASKIDGIKRIRLGSLEPDLVSREDIKKWSEYKKLCPQFHFSLQSGCDQTLKRMNRHYTAKDYADLISDLRKYFPDCAITTDIMVGFPGETDEEFAESLAFSKKIVFAKTHVFEFSPREGTKAYDMQNQISPEVKSKRSAELIEASKNSQSDFLDSQIGKIHEVLLESFKDGYYIGHTKNYCLFKTKSDENIEGKILEIKADLRKGESLFGEADASLIRN